MSEVKFSVMRHQQEFLIVKSSGGKSYAVGSVYLESTAELVAGLLESHFNETEKQIEQKSE